MKIKFKKKWWVPWGRESCQEWSIGIFTGDSPLQLTSPAGLRNPVLSARDVSDVTADFVADPFMLKDEDTWYLFFEVWNRKTDKGEIGLACSKDGFLWQYRQIVLKEDFHLSYPYVFKWQQDYWMVLEALETGSVRLYHAGDFPTGWTFVTPLLEGNFTDPSVFRFDDRWWLFTCTTPFGHDTLRLYYSHHLQGKWQEHPGSPIVKDNNRNARPAGRVTIWNNHLIRYAQDCSPCYGTGVRAFEITQLSTSKYIEKEREENPILKAGPNKWNQRGMHHLDPHSYFDGKWIACVDGWRMVYR